MTSQIRTTARPITFGRLRRTAGIAASASVLALAAGLASISPATASSAPTGGGIIRPDDAAPTGWAAVGRATNGGAGAPAENRYEVSTLAGLKAALANHGDPTAAKIIYINGTIDGNQTPDGRILGEQDYAAGYDIHKYMSCFGPEGKVWERPDL
ncbi:hypothetical protein [Arthrobacter sp. Cr_A7]|uniref:hypothetical protein n=1 Tax=Arthrobacter sp. Cr_A7 TaxID=3031017 RepID=UPI0023DBAFC4|nr:hypothetical protein [Arthrobacter sp. Cr_A7]MDF2049127.1 hypothetical protein [Arthrobacter sp. Cr_A7]